MCDTHDIVGCAVCAGIVERYEPPEPTDRVQRIPTDHSAEALKISSQPAHTRPQAFIHNGPLTSEHGYMTLFRLNNAPSYAERKRKPAPKPKPKPESVTTVCSPMAEANQELAQRLGVTL